MKISFPFVVLLLTLPKAGSGQPSQAWRDSINRLSQEDHQYVMQQLGIGNLRPGANGMDPKAPNAPNYDEDKANPFPVLPEALTLHNGQKVRDAKTWREKRRPEIVEDFDREMYGRVPANMPAVNWAVLNVKDSVIAGIPVKIKQLSGQVDNSGYPGMEVNIELSLVTPAKTTGPVPVILELSFRFPPGFKLPPPPADQPVYTDWRQQLLEKGWGYAQIIPVSFQADNGAGLTQGIIGLVNQGKRRKPDDWGAIRAWAWGASRALDYFESDRDVDARRVGITGHSRFGKTAAVAMAYDPRFAIAFVSSSGAAGLKLHRRNYGEMVENVAGSGEYHWMAGNYIKYAADPYSAADLPVDAHELVALCAPRPVFISSGDKGDGWCDAKGMFLAGVHAGPVYELLGKKGLGTSDFPALETGLLNGDIAFRQHAGGHTPAPNWGAFIQFADRYFSSATGNTVAATPPGQKARSGWINLLDENLSQWETYLSYRHQAGYKGAVPLDEKGDSIAPLGYNTDPDRVFTVIKTDGEPVLRVSGTYYGCVFSKAEYSNYILRLKVKWGEKKWEPRTTLLKDAGILYHSQGPCGVDYWRSWMLGQEFQLMEGHFGDYWSIANSAIDIHAYLPEGMMNPVAEPGQPLLPVGRGTGLPGYCMRSENRESPPGEWTQVELVCFGRKSLHIVNGKVVMVLENSRYFDKNGYWPLAKGKIQLQSEACELFYKDIKIKPITELDKKYRRYFE